MRERKRVRHVSSEVRQAARELRRSATGAEGVLWEQLRGGRLEGLKFRRQHAVGRFVLDFYCVASRLAIELDGSVHDEQQERDAERTAELEAHGLRVIRFRNEEVVNDLPTVLAQIHTEAMRSTVPPSPRIGRGGAGARNERRRG